LLVLATFVVVALIVGLLIVLAGGNDERQLVTRYVKAWSRGDYHSMYSMLDKDSQESVSEPRFKAAYRAAAETATLTSIVPGKVGNRSHDAIPVRMRVGTKSFGTLREVLLVPLTGSGSSAHVQFSRELLFPGLRGNERLGRTAVLPPRATLYASNGVPLAQGPDRVSPIPDVAGQIVGTLGPIPASQRSAYEAQGYPPNAKVGIDGLEHIFQSDLAGAAGGKLLAGSRVLVRAKPVPGHSVKTTIDPTIERAVVTAMGGQYSGIAAMDPRTGALLALAGVAFSAVQPPGSTMKIITATGALQAGIVKLGSTFPIATSANLEGFNLQNANGEACGGTFLNAFAVSCNSVFAPLGARLGGARLVSTAEKFGFNQPMPIPGATESTIPPANQIGDSLAVGSSAIGQGKVQASALQMTDVAATIAMGGRRPIPTLRYGAPPKFVRVTSGHVAREVQKMMIAVVDFGTGTSAEIPGVVVAGKTGTAELTNTAAPGSSNNPADTDAWFVGYAPVPAPRIAVGALFPSAGAGGQTAAPAVRGVLEAALQSH
jgi:penicillin-binding protein A